jgi:hypothetical protein
MTANELPVIPVALDDAKIISVSQVNSFTDCQRKHGFSYLYQKQSPTMSRALSIGVGTHEILASFYRALKAGMNKVEAQQEAMKDLTAMFTEGTYDFEVLQMIYSLVDRYIEQEVLSKFAKVLEVEQDFFLPINEEYWFGMRLDLLLEATAGNMKGKIILVDQKTTYDFWSADDLLLDMQMPKYVVPVRFAGYPVAEAYINQFRTRFKSDKIPEKSNEDLFRLSPVGIEPERVRNAMAHQMRVSERIIERLKMPVELAMAEAVPNRNKMLCRSCPFKQPCIMMENGYSAQKALGNNYVDKQSGFQLGAKADEDGSETS